MKLIYFFIAIAAALKDNEYRACWDVRLTDENLFCYGAVNWPLDEETFYNAERQDQQAKDMYRALLYKWEMRENVLSDDPKDDCLAVAR